MLGFQRNSQVQSVRVREWRTQPNQSRAEGIVREEGVTESLNTALDGVMEL